MPTKVSTPVGAKPRLLAADAHGLPLTLFFGGSLVVGFGFALYASVPKDSWTYDFFFKRSFVQWVLLSVFAVGLVHVLRRVPAWLGEKHALKTPRDEATPLESKTLVTRRRIQLEAARRERGRKNLGQYAKSLAEHDEAEIEAAYRLSGDAVQMLPLIGFFGTVFGLSHGLYQSFLTTGGTTTQGSQPEPA